MGCFLDGFNEECPQCIPMHVTKKKKKVDQNTCTLLMPLHAGEISLMLSSIKQLSSSVHRRTPSIRHRLSSCYSVHADLTPFAST